MESVVENALRKYFEETIGSEENSKYLSFVFDDGAKGVGGRTGDYLSGKISYEKDGKTQLSKELFIKITRDIGTLEMGKIMLPKGVMTVIFINELYFYSVMKPFFDSFKKTDALIPVFNGSSLDATDEGNIGVMIFDNLRNSEYIACKDQFPDYNHLSLMMRKIGQYHAYSYQAKKKKSFHFYTISELFKKVIFVNPTPTSVWIQNRFQNALKPLRSDTSYASALKMIDGMMKNLREVYKQQNEIDKNDKMAVLVHNACRAENMLFRYKDGKPVDLKILDWQTAGLASLSIDIILILYLEATQSIREQKWDDLLDEYYAGLSQTFSDIDIPSKEEVKEEVKKKLWSVLFVLWQKYSKGAQDLDDDPVTDILKDILRRCY